MKLLIVLITHNRLKYTIRTLQSLKDTLNIPSYIIVADNDSSDGTQEYLLRHKKNQYLIDKIILNTENLYPGKACNNAWFEGLKEYPEATHLMRLDNDMEFKQGWDTTAEDYFKCIPELGQLGLDHEAIEHPKASLRVMDINGRQLNPWPGCVGGPNIIRRKIWDDGVRYEAVKWDDGRQSPMQEDSMFSKAIKNRGYLVGHMTENLARTFANESNWGDYPEYYKKTMTDRGYLDNLKKIREK